MALGAAHDLLQFDELVVQLVSHDEFTDQVRAIVFEAGNALHQPVVDRYLAGEDVPIEELRKVWRDIVGAPVGVLDGAERFFRAVRQRNAELPAARQIVVRLGDPPFDWSAPDVPGRFGDALAQRDSHFAEVALEAEREFGKVLMIAGALHFARLSEETYGGLNVVGELESEGASVFVIVPHAGGAVDVGGFETEFEGWRAPALAEVAGTELGGLTADRLFPTPRVFSNPGGGPSDGGFLPSPEGGADDPVTGELPPPGDASTGAMPVPPGGDVSPYAALSLDTVTDAVLFLGTCDVLRRTPVSRQPYDDPEYRAVLGARSMALTGQGFTPPPSPDRDASYCPPAG